MEYCNPLSATGPGRQVTSSVGELSNESGKIQENEKIFHFPIAY